MDSDCEELLARLKRRCDGTHQHAPCAGRDTKASEGYTDSISREVHRAWQQHCANLSIGAVAVAARVVPLAACTVSRFTHPLPFAPPHQAMASSGFSAADIAAAAASGPAEEPSVVPGSEGCAGLYGATPADVATTSSPQGPPGGAPEGAV